MTDATPLRLLVLGAHPDDAEFHAGGLITLYRQLGHQVRIVSVTDGSAGHHELKSGELSLVRRGEAADVARLAGLEYDVWEFPDGHLQPTLEVRHRIIGEIRSYAPDLVLTHRTNDYHPDHRAVGQAVQDASFLVTVPLVVPEFTALRKDPVVAYMTDFFTRPNPLRPDVVLDIDLCFERIVDMLACHRSQVYQWLPYNQGVLDQVPSGEEDRRQWLAEWFKRRATAVAERFRSELIATYGRQRGETIQFAEAYEVSEYAAPMDEPRKQSLFPVNG